MDTEENPGSMLKALKPKHQVGDYVFCHVKDPADRILKDALMNFKEEEGVTLIVEKNRADALGLGYGFTAAWITLTVQSSLESVGLTAAFSTALSQAGISCNVVAAFYHDHIFVGKNDVDQAMAVLHDVSEQGFKSR